jgi:uncharacterized membrane protein/glutaredoxin
VLHFVVAEFQMASKGGASVARKRTLATYAVVLQVVGLLLSIQLFANHFSSAPAVCEMGKYVSCAAVQNSPWAFVLGVPLAFHGIVFFVLGLGLALYLAGPREDDAEVAAAFAVYQAIGLLSVAYFVVGEIALGALCPLCTAVHVAVVASLFVALRISRLRSPLFAPSPAALARLAWAMRTWLLVAVLLVGTPTVALHVMRAPDRVYSDAQLQDFGRCLAKQRMTLYTKADCPYCSKQKELLSVAADAVTTVACGEGSMGPCEAQNIYAFPTWIKRSNSAYVRDIVSGGLQTIAHLSDISGCKMQADA